MMSEPLRIRGVGLAASLGVSAVPACAAARSGISRPSPLEVASEDPESGLEEPVSGHVLRDVTNGFVGVARLWRLADRACSDLSSTSELTARDGPKTCLWLHVRDAYWDMVALAPDRTVPKEELKEDLPEEWVEERRRFEARVESVLLRRLGERLGIAADRQFVSFGGAAETMDAWIQAAGQMRSRGLKRCIVGSVDSLADPSTAMTLAQLGMLKSGENPVGLAPGEAAAFVALEEPSSEPSAASPFSPLRITSVVHRPDAERHRFANLPASGHTVASSLARTLGHPGERPAPTVAIGSFNGDPYGAAEWGDALVRLRARGWPVDYETWFPAVNFGDTGAASAALGVCIAARAFVRGYNRSASILVWCTSPSGAAGSCLVSKEEPGAAA